MTTTAICSAAFDETQYFGYDVEPFLAVAIGITIL